LDAKGHDLVLTMAKLNAERTRFETERNNANAHLNQVNSDCYRCKSVIDSGMQNMANALDRQERRLMQDQKSDMEFLEAQRTKRLREDQEARDRRTKEEEKWKQFEKAKDLKDAKDKPKPEAEKQQAERQHQTEKKRFEDSETYQAAKAKTEREEEDKQAKVRDQNFTTRKKDLGKYREAHTKHKSSLEKELKQWVESRERAESDLKKCIDKLNDNENSQMKQAKLCDKIPRKAAPIVNGAQTVLPEAHGGGEENKREKETGETGGSE